MNTTKIIVTRHGETQWNVEGKIQGQLDSPLTELGLRQAQALGGRLKQEAFSQIYSSDLGRCRHTAQVIAEATGQAIQSIQFDQRLRERGFGILQGLTWSQVSANHPEVAKAIRAGTPDYIVPEGENYRMILQRALACLENLSHRHPGELILVVSHGGVLNILFKHLLGVPLDAVRKFHIQNAGVNVIARTEESWMVETLGDVSHLKRLNTADEMMR